jgi:hypothetical protein
MNIRRVVPATLGSLVLAAACAASPMTSLSHATSRPAAATEHAANASPPHCNDAYFQFLPGYTKYCYGMRKWYAGRYRDALFDIKDAAGWANKNAQYTLGLIYFSGHHVAVDRPLGLAWLLLAAERKTPQHFTDVAAAAYKAATPTQRTQALQLLVQLRPRYGDAYAAHRAKEHFSRALAALIPKGDDVYGPLVCVDGLTGGIPGSPSSDISPQGTPTGNARFGSLGSASTPTGTAGSCSSSMVVEHILKRASNAYFEGLTPTGHVDVSPIQQVPAPVAKN